MFHKSNIIQNYNGNTMPRMLEDARYYQDLGFSQLPLTGKVPALDHWIHLTQRRPTDAELLLWFYNARYNIGIICGHISGIVALDADSHEIADRLARELPPTDMKTRTAKGMHFFYRLEPGQNVPSRVRVNKMLLDIRSEASYVVAAPSIHPETRKPYERVGSWDLQKVPFFSTSWLDDFETDAVFVRRNVRNPLSYITHIRALSGSGGSNATFRAGCILRDAGLSEAEALAALIEWNQTNAEPQWTVKELLHKVQNVFSKNPLKGEFSHE
jgi:hypothetical protein